ncbi:L-threonylcarbamoyladenylate synthase [soil metagenome]
MAPVATPDSTGPSDDGAAGSDAGATRAGEVVRVAAERPDAAVVGRAGRLLADGGLVAFPTETVYGLGAHAFDVEAVHAVFRGKGRPATDPLIVHVADTALVTEVVSQFPPAAAELAARFWPGPLTMVLPRTAAVPDAITAGRDTVAVRVPAHPVTLAVLRAAGVPVAAPSANRFGRVSPTTADHVISELHGVYDLLLDAGPTPLGVESTVIDLTGPVPVLLRPGGVTLEQLRATLGPVDYEERAATDEADDASAPGQFLRHYAPTTPMILVDGPPGAVDDLAHALRAKQVTVGIIMSPVDPADAAHRLYGSLRNADAEGAQLLLTSTVDPAGMGRAVNDRLFRAAQGRSVTDAATATVDRILALLSG